MNIFLLIGTSVVNIALIFYTIAIIREQKNKLVNNATLIFFNIGVISDITATICMITGSTHTALSSHGIIGYSALLIMITECVLLWKHWLTKGQKTEVTLKLHLFSRYAYIWWVIAYFTGIVIMAIRHVK